MKFFVSFLIWLFGFSPSESPAGFGISPSQTYVSPLHDEFDAGHILEVQKNHNSNIIIVVEDTHFKPLRKEVKE